jgi:hypothetical protein
MQHQESGHVFFGSLLSAGIDEIISNNIPLAVCLANLPNSSSTETEKAPRWQIYW